MFQLRKKNKCKSVNFELANVYTLSMDKLGQWPNLLPLFGDAVVESEHKNLLTCQAPATKSVIHRLGSRSPPVSHALAALEQQPTCFVAVFLPDTQFLHSPSPVLPYLLGKILM